MKKFYVFLMVILMFAVAGNAQNNITVSFYGTGQNNLNQSLNKVVVKNLFRNWTDTLISPDLTLTLTVNTGIDESSADEFLVSQNVPNPFSGRTSVEVLMPEGDEVRMQIYDLSGRLYVGKTTYLSAGKHSFEISLANPQTYILDVATSKYSKSIKMSNAGFGSQNLIEYKYVEHFKKMTTKPFALGDVMMYVGQGTYNAQTVESSAVVQQQNGSEVINLQFSYSSILAPTVMTNAATNVTFDAATLNGNVTSDAGTEVTSRGFYYGTSASNLTNSVISGSGTGEFTYSLTNLTASTAYYYIAFASNAGGTAYGEVKSFTTRAPSVTTNEATSITSVTALLNGNVTSDGGTTVISRGFYYGTSSSNLPNCIIRGDSTGVFTYNLTGLTPSTTYYYKAFATNAGGTAYGEVKSFTTRYPSVTTNAATNITITAATLNGNADCTEVTSRGFYYGTDSTSLTDSVNRGSGLGIFTYNLTGLTPSTTYYYKSFATNAGGTLYGEVKSFMTYSGSFIDTRDNTTYFTIKIGTQTWMAENLKYLPSVDSLENGSMDAAYYYVYGYNGEDTSAAKSYTLARAVNGVTAGTNTYETFGVLYNWTAAMSGSSSSSANPSGIQGACPSGWHLPSDAEWTEMEMYLGMSQTDADNIWYRGAPVGSKLAGNADLWYNNSTLETTTGFGTSSFSALQGGLWAYNYGGSSCDLSYGGNWWTATEYSSTYAWRRYLVYDDAGVNRYCNRNKNYGYSVRCVRNY